MVDGKEVPFRVVRSSGRRKTIALQMRPNGIIVVRAPIRTTAKRIQEVLRRKTEWLSARRRVALANAMPTQSAKEFVAGESFSLLGLQRRLMFVRKEGPNTAFALGRSLVVSTPGKHLPTKRETRSALSAFFRREAAVVFDRRLQRFLAKLGLKEAPRLFVADQTRRWGSCNDRGELRLNWRLVGAQLSLVDYVIAHELCHLQWSDHSTHFWRELRRLMPDYETRESALSETGPSLIF